MRAITLSLLFALQTVFTSAQIFEPVKWKFQCTPLESDEYLFTATATIDAGWHVYALQVSDDPNAIGPIPTSLKFRQSGDIEILGKATEGKFITHHDPNFEMELMFRRVNYALLLKDPSQANLKIGGSVDATGLALSGRYIF